MSSDSLSHLTPAEREELSLCGISTRKQLLQIDPVKLWRDLQQAKECFPSRQFVFTRERLMALYDEEPAPEAVPAQKTKEVGFEVKQIETSSDELKIERATPEVRFQQRTRDRNEVSSSKSQNRNIAVNLHSSVRCTHPFRAVFGALGTLTLIIPLLSLVGLPYIMITNCLPDVPIDMLAAALFILPCLAYIIFARLATCPVCHMRTFRFAHYTRNRAAHYLPLLGYNFTTALHMLIFWRYNCPACGTPVKFYGVKGHRTLR